MTNYYCSEVNNTFTSNYTTWPYKTEFTVITFAEVFNFTQESRNYKCSFSLKKELLATPRTSLIDWDILYTNSTRVMFQAMHHTYCKNFSYLKMNNHEDILKASIHNQHNTKHFTGFPVVYLVKNQWIESKAVRVPI